jgi:peptidoglycan/LPS O-acetylase OafA/YrhL
MEASVSYYRKDIDGLRALAVLGVVFFHAGMPWFQGGFVGVDVFFVISGYVVSRAILRALEDGNFSFVDFYVRRAKRLAPALYLVMACVLVFSLLWLMPADAVRVLRTMAYASLLSANVFLAKKADYFASEASQMPLLHVWSLSVEEQFYLLLPGLLFLVRRWPMRRRLALYALLFAASLLASQWAVSRGLAGAYFLVPYRGFEFMLGVLLACFSRPIDARIADVLLGAGLVIVLSAMVALHAAVPYPGWMALIPCLGAGAIVGWGGSSRMAGMLLGAPPMVFLGRISYSLYLWHWPVLFAWKRFQLDATGGRWLAIGISIGLGYACYRYVEAPLRHLQMGRFRAGVSYIAAPILGIALLFFLEQHTDHFVKLYPAAFQRLYASVQPPWEGRRGKQCWGHVEVTDEAACKLGATELSVSAALWGDSHAYHLINFMDQLGKDYGLSVHDLAMPQCPPIVGVPPGAEAKLPLEKCPLHNRKVLQYLLEQPRITTVFLSAAWSSYVDRPGMSEFGVSQQGLASDLDDTVARLRRAGKQVVLFDDVPQAPERLVDCPLYNAIWLPMRVMACSFSKDEAQGDRRAVDTMLRQLIGKYPQIGLINTYDVPCEKDRCLVSLGNVPLYMLHDFGHLNLASSAAYYPAYNSKHPGQLERVLGRRAHSVPDVRSALMSP